MSPAGAAAALPASGCRPPAHPPHRGSAGLPAAAAPPAAVPAPHPPAYRWRSCPIPVPRQGHRVRPDTCAARVRAPPPSVHRRGPAPAAGDVQPAAGGPAHPATSGARLLRSAPPPCAAAPVRKIRHTAVRPPAHPAHCPAAGWPAGRPCGPAHRKPTHPAPPSPPGRHPETAPAGRCAALPVRWYRPDRAQHPPRRHDHAGPAHAVQSRAMLRPHPHQPHAGFLISHAHTPPAAPPPHRWPHPRTAPACRAAAAQALRGPDPTSARRSCRSAASHPAWPADTPR